MDGPSGVDVIDAADRDGLRISALPGEGRFTLTMDAPWTSGTWISVVDLNGRAVPVHITRNTTGATLDASALAHGCYVVAVSDGNALRSAHFVK
jgi:hypothetical protein